MADRDHANCPVCDYSAPPDRVRTERKHFTAHSLRCTRCAYQTETKASFTEALRFWNKARSAAAAREVGALSASPAQGANSAQEP